MLIVFDKERLVFDSRDLLDGYKTSIVNLPISIEVKYFDGVAPCGLALKINKEDLDEIKVILENHNIFINHLFEVVENDQEYKKVKSE